MIEFAEDKVIFSRQTWEDLKSDDFYREIIDAIEDREALIKAIEDTDYIVSFKEYDKNRKARMNV